MKDVKEYTARKLGEHMLATEIHLTDYMQDSNKTINTEEDKDFCVECLAKHALAISALAQEGSQFFDNATIFTNIYNTTVELYNDVPDFKLDVAKKYYDNIRKLRKDLVAQHLILGIKPPRDNTGSQKHLPDCPNCK